MYLDSKDRRPAMTPRLALRVAVIGGAALALFAIVFFRLWFLQVLSGEEYRQEANDNRVREIKVQAPRGEIVDRNGNVLVENRVGLAVKLAPNEIPAEGPERETLYKRLGNVLGVSTDQIDRRVDDQLEELPFSSPTIEQDVELPRIQHILENQEDFPGVTVERVFLRTYPHDELAAHLFGYVGEVSPDQLEEERFREVEQGDLVGQAGIESTYDRYLRGQNGATRVVVDALGDFQSEANVQEPVQGKQLRLSLDLDVQQAGQEQIAGAEAAFVVMDVRNGEIVGMGSSPAYEPSLFTGGIEQSDYEKLTNEEEGAPLTNRATQGLYPTGSTWKLITATAALEDGLLTPTETLVDGGSITSGGITFQNAGGASYGALQLPQALEVSSDVFFYQLGQRANSTGDGLAIQEWAERLGFGAPTGIDVPGELGGLVPTPEWRNDLFEEAQTQGSPGGEEIVEGVETDRPWSEGDAINLSVGQGDLQATPLQLATAYATVANGGTVVQPHLGQRIEDPDGRPIQELEFNGTRKVDIAPEHRNAIMQGLFQAANGPGGTSTDVFAGFPIDIAGKTGTAENTDGTDQSWYAALAPYPEPRYVAVATFEDGGFGAETAAPAVREILAALFEVEEKGETSAGEALD